MEIPQQQERHPPQWKFSRAHPRISRPRPAPGRRKLWLTAEVASQLVIALVGVFLYFGVRGLMSQSAGPAVQNAKTIVDIEMALRFYWEPAWQNLIIHSPFLVSLANWAYIYLHWPVIAVTAVWLFARHRAEYSIYRNAFLISGALGLVLFVLFPVAPPRLADLGFSDTVTLHSNSYRVLQPPALVNQYAAFPSLHFGWNLLIGAAIFTNSKQLVVRGFGLALPGLMLFAIIATANHYLIDALAGGALSLTALGVSQWWSGPSRTIGRLAPRSVRSAPPWRRLSK